jgi:predicted DNA binding CopG/RHH family protein
MLTIQIRDEQLARQLQQIAERENRPVEDVLRTMVAQYSTEMPSASAKPDKSEAVKRVRRKAYAKARHYWQSVGDIKKAAMTSCPPEQLAKADQVVKVTIALSQESIDFFKTQAKAHNTSYQQMIRRLLDEYVQRHQHV